MIQPAIPSIHWTDFRGFTHQGETTGNYVMPIAGKPDEIATGEVRQDLYNMRDIMAYVSRVPGLQGGTKETTPWEKKKAVASIEEGKAWVETTLTTLFMTSPLPWVREVGDSA